jgi:transcription elongation GreA/GreB family factor
MNKKLLLEEVIGALQSTYENAREAAMRAYNTATDGENVAENKYDTLALEASYLAHGQAQRVTQCEADISAFKKLSVLNRSNYFSVRLGAFVELIDDQDKVKYFFLGPSAGGLKVTVCQKEVTIVTPGSPLGSALMDRQLNDEISVKIANQVINYEIVMIF